MNNSTQRAVSFLIKDGKIILLRRVKNRVHYFVFPGGSVEDGETLEEALIRELDEELSIKAIPGEMVYEEYIKNDYDVGRTSYFYLVTDFSGELELGGPEKERMNEDDQFYIHEMALADIEKTDNLYPEGARKFIVNYLKENKFI